VKHALLFLALTACGPSHIGAYVERERNYEAGPYEREARPVSEGSLWMDESRGLFADFRATRVGDILTVRIDENPTRRPRWTASRT
jgi:flagellar basal body L-ring protein FlgH